MKRCIYCLAALTLVWTLSLTILPSLIGPADGVQVAMGPAMDPHGVPVVSA